MIDRDLSGHDETFVTAPADAKLEKFKGVAKLRDIECVFGLALCFFGGLYPLVALARCPLCARCMRIHLTRMSMHAHADHRSCGDVSGVGR